MTDSLELLTAALAARYRIEREAGAGGMATVYQAEDLRHHRQVAVKVLRPELAATLGSERFLREIEVAAQLQHPHILPLLDSGEAAGFLYYVMPYVDGPSLRERMAQGELPMHDAVRTLAHVVDALAEAHRKGIVHRDVKPDNVMLTGRHALVTDFGVAKAVNDAIGRQNLTTVGVALGTPAYMAPEQAAADANIDHRADIYAVGVMAYELLTGAPPFVGSSAQAVLAAHMAQAPERLRARRASVPLLLEAIVLKCLAKKPADRWQSAEELLRELEAFQTPSGGVTSPRAVASALALAVRRPAVGIPVALLLVAATAAAVWSWNRSRETRWATEQALPGIAMHADSGEWEAAYALAVRAHKVIPHNAALAALWPRFSWLVTIPTVPAGATVLRREYSAGGDRWEEMGTTPLRGVHFPFGYSLVRVELAGHVPLLQALGRPLEGGRMQQDTIRLDLEESVPRGMLRVPGEPPGSSPFAFTDFFLGRNEVTNREFKEFVVAGGYQKRELWEHPFIQSGVEVPWEQGIAMFVDKTARPGPSSWEAGDYPEGQGDYPVGGLSWYEAAAYARFARQELPTVDHWRLALGGEDAQWVWPASNLDAKGPAPVGQFRGITWSGANDMVGNVREWAYNAMGDKRCIMGGGWSDESAFYSPGNIQAYLPPFDRSATNGLRLALTHDDSVRREHWRQPRPETPARDVTTEPAISDDSLQAFRRMYAYDPTPLRARTESRDSTRTWVRERVSFEAGYGGERVILYLYLPRRGSPPYQTLVYSPGAPAFFLDSIDQYRADHLEFVLKSGRALAFPVYVKTFERRRSAPIAYRQRVLLTATDLRRTLDYLATRQDIDSTKLAYYGYSAGGGGAPPILALEPRLRVAVLYMAGLWPRRQRFAEIEPVVFLPRVFIPVIMFSGARDDGFPLETSAKPFFRLLGTPEKDKKHVIAPGSHFVSRPVLIKETLDWLDRYLGSVK